MIFYFTVVTISMTVMLLISLHLLKKAKERLNESDE